MPEQHKRHGLGRDHRIDVVGHHIAHPHRFEPDQVAGRDAVGGAHLDATTLVELEVDAPRFGSAQCDRGRSGVHHELHALAIDLAVGQEVTAGVGGQHHALSAATGAALAHADGRPAHLQRLALSVDLQNGGVATDRQQLHPGMRLAGAEEFGGCAIDDDQCPIARNTREGQAGSLRLGGCGQGDESGSQPAQETKAQGHHGILAVWVSGFFRRSRRYRCSGWPGRSAAWRVPPRSWRRCGPDRRWSESTGCAPSTH